jgi:hypothetical protein
VPPSHVRKTAPTSSPGRPQRHRPLPRRTFLAWIVLSMQALAVPAVFYRKRLLTPDALAAALAKAWSVWTNNRGAFASPRHLLNWLKRTAFCQAVDGFRKQRRRRQHALGDGEAAQLPDRESSAGPRRWSAANQQLVWACLEKLPSPFREILEGHYYDRLTDRQLALRLWGDPTPAAGLRVWRLRRKALLRLRCMLAHHGVTS